jgi:hypothetical protein
MEYIYKNDQGEMIVLDFPIAKAPQKTTVDGVVFERDLAAELNGKSFCLKGGGWPTQDSFRKKQMTRKNIEAGQRSKGTWGEPMSVTPNYQGEVCQSWDEAENLKKKDKE